MSIGNAIRQAMETHRKLVEELYWDVCTVYEYKPVKDEITKLTSAKEVPVLEKQLCKISFESTDTTSDSESAAEKRISTKLFISPDVVINPGSKIVVTHNGETTAYSSTGVPGKFISHQEIELKLFERWA